jgi:hypothetical protein
MICTMAGLFPAIVVLRTAMAVKARRSVFLGTIP